MLREKYFVCPPRAIYTAGPAGGWSGKYHSYSNYNYLRPGLISRIKRARFDIALRLTDKRFGPVDVIDFGCADGVFLPSLSRYYRRVVGIDRYQKFIDLSTKLVDSLSLPNVSVICNADLSFDDLRSRIPPGDYKLAYLLETLEHVGPEPYDGFRLYEAKVDFLNGVFSLLADDGMIVVSVPKMVGLPFLAKHATQVLLRLPREQFTLGELAQATLFKNTDDLESRWAGGHVGFNHLKLERHLRQAFVVEQVLDTLVTVFYLLRKPRPRR